MARDLHLLTRVALDSSKPTPVCVPSELAGLRRVLLIDSSELLRDLDPRPGIRDIILTQYRLLGPSMLAQVQPEGIVAPLIGQGWDLVDLADRLTMMKWSGILFAITPALPRRDLVMHEVEGLFPKLRLRLLEI